MTLGIIVVYMALVIGIGVVSNRLLSGAGDDYFLAARSIGPVVLLMSLFGTNMTAFALLGSSGEAYHAGVGVFGLMPAISGLVIPTVFFILAPRAWAIGKRHGYTTQVQFFRDRWGSDALGLLLFVVLVSLVIPYLLIGVMAGGITLNQVTFGAVPEWIGGLVICLVVMCYVTFGGLRGTAWVNTFQTVVFMILGAVTVGVVFSRMGGVGAVMARIAEEAPNLLVREGNFSRVHWLSYTLIPLSAGMFPHMFMHWLSAKRADNFKLTVRLYPLCIALVWLPPVLLGVAGNLDFPGLVGGQSNSILVQMIGLHAPGVLAGLLGAGVFAAVMSSLDSQVLSLGTMFTEDIVDHYGYGDGMNDKQRVATGRIFVAGILVMVYLMSLFSQRSIFDLATWSFTGFASLFPIVVGALFWRRSTKVGAIACVSTVVVLWLYFFTEGWSAGSVQVADTDIMAVAVILAGSTVAMIVGSLLSSPPEKERIDRFIASS
ncbi:MAG: sodium:solute symporter family protein [Acidobacteria bacterium]|nr:sodium:solute symporter family protein [Acidobacteriota bacterium]